MATVVYTLCALLSLACAALLLRAWRAITAAARGEMYVESTAR